MARSGARISGTAALELRERGGRYSLATMCIGVGQAIAMAPEGRKQHYRAGMHLLKRRVCTSFRQQALRRKI